MELELVKNNEHSFEIRSSFNNKLLGSATMDIDGYYYFWPEDNLSGSWSSHNLREIAEILEKLNSDYEKTIKQSHSN